MVQAMMRMQQEQMAFMAQQHRDAAHQQAQLVDRALAAQAAARPVPQPQVPPMPGHGHEGGGGGGGRASVRVRAEVEWPTFDGKDVYYDIEDFLRDFRRVCMLCSAGRGLPGHERLEMLRGALKGTPLVDLRTYLDDNQDRTQILERGTAEERNALADVVEQYLVASHHRPLLERQRRAKAEYDSVSMKMDPSMDYATFQAEFRKCCNNLQRARL